MGKVINGLSLASLSISVGGLHITDYCCPMKLFKLK